MFITDPRARSGLTLVCGIGLYLGLPVQSFGQEAGRALTLDAALEAARRVSPALRSTREAAAAAAGRARQAGAYPNPSFSYGREQTSASGETNTQNILAIEQRLELGGVRGARIAAAELRHEAAVARVAAAEAQLTYETTRAYVLALAADRRAALAQEAASAFRDAVTVSETRLAAGDVSGYAHRRLRLEAARYATVYVEAALARRTARLALAVLVTGNPDSVPTVELVLADSLPSRVELSVTADAEQRRQAPEPERGALVGQALASRADLRAATLEAEAARAEARLAARERVPTPALSVGFKNERSPGAVETAGGFTAGLSIPLPLWDRRSGNIAATEAEWRGRQADAGSQRRLVVREVAEAYDAFVAVQSQLAALAPELGEAARSTVRAAQVAYTEGEITLVEWLDAMRAYQETEARYATLRAEAVIRRAALERAVGAPVAPQPSDEPSGG